MTPADLFNAFLKLSEEEREQFLGTLMMWTDLNLPDGKFMVMTKEQYRRATHIHAPQHNCGLDCPLYDVAMQVCHQFGMPYTHPVTGVTTPPPRKRKTRKKR